MAKSEKKKVAKEFGPVAQVVNARRRFPKERDRLVWAVDLAQKDLATITPGNWQDLKVETAAFIATWASEKIKEPIKEPEWTAYHVQLPLFSELEIEQTQKRFQEIFESLVENGSALLGKFTYEEWVIVNEYQWWEGSSLLRKFEPPFRSELAVSALGLILKNHAPLVKKCLAPRPRGSEGEACGRLFVGRPNQTYCSPQCQNRASTQATRRTFDCGDYRIRPISFLSPKNGWIAKALIFSRNRAPAMEKTEIIDPKTNYFDTREEADEYAIELSKKAIRRLKMPKRNQKRRTK